MTMTITMTTASMDAATVAANDNDDAQQPQPQQQQQPQPQQQIQCDNVVQQEVQQACCTIGFFAIQNHGVFSTMMQTTWHVMQQFFDVPDQIKQQYFSTDNEWEYPYGYERCKEVLQCGKQLDHNDDNEKDCKSNTNCSGHIIH